MEVLPEMAQAAFSKIKAVRQRLLPPSQDFYSAGWTASRARRDLTRQFPVAGSFGYSSEQKPKDLHCNFIAVGLGYSGRWQLAVILGIWRWPGAGFFEKLKAEARNQNFWLGRLSRNDAIETQVVAPWIFA